MFFVAVLPQFIGPKEPVALQVAILTLASVGLELVVLSGYAVVAARLRRSAAAGRAALWIERAGGAVLIAFASRVVRELLAHAP